ncbi:MAG: TIGR00725 family protein [Chloroflexota bacterium]|nr:TIGR00725 family protein [Chloroflexota bacterium]
MLISIIGESNASHKNYSLAEEVGRLLAEAEVTVVCGGMGGVMEAVCKGASNAGGRTVGILPGVNPTDANPWVDIPICTGLGHARNVIVVRSGLAVVAIGGAYGTLSEIGHALSDEIPVIGLNTWSFNRERNEDDSLHICKTPAQAVKTALLLANKRLHNCEN